MHLMSPGVERAIANARRWADRQESAQVRLHHHLLALLDEEEGRPAVLLEQAGLVVAGVREQLAAKTDSPPAPAENVLFNQARSWSLQHRHDPEFLTDAFFLAVLRYDSNFQHWATSIGLSPDHLEQILIGRPETATPLAGEVHPTSFVLPETPQDARVDRILDANWNRAREAARVIEDYCRFALDDRILTEEAKQLRHALAALSSQFLPRAMLTSRNTVGDVGTTVTAGNEYSRADATQVAAINCKRLQEALRSLEEYSKLPGTELAQQLESLRYRAYTLERAILLGTHSRERLATARLYVLLSAAQCSASLDWVIEQAAVGGADVIQLREKQLSDRELLHRARQVRRYTRQHKLLFIVNDRPDIARLVEADGVHLGQDDLSVADARRIVGPDLLIGVSTHTIEQVRQAVLDGADYLGIGPVFPSATKTFDHFPGLEFIRAASIETSLPAFALGGISPANVAQVVAAGARRIAVSSAIAAAEEPAQISRLLRAALE
jgi:thiamine-phosphate pyrophosphorylase